MTEEMTYVIQEMKKVDIDEITRDEKCTDKITKIWENEMDNDINGKICHMTAMTYDI